jgi:hypothetical protein
MERISEVTYCGIYCPNCGVRSRLPKQAGALLATMKAGEWDDFGHGIEGFTPFWKFLHGLADESVNKSCRNGTCGAPNCTIRACAKNKKIEVCPLCTQYPCDLIKQFARSEPTLIFDGERMKEIGLEKWIDEQYERRRRDFSYDDVRSGKSKIPQTDA